MVSNGTGSEENTASRAYSVVGSVLVCGCDVIRSTNDEYSATGLPLSFSMDESTDDVMGVRDDVTTIDGCAILKLSGGGGEDDEVSEMMFLEWI